MSRVSKVLLRSGVYEAPQGTLVATPARVRGWAEKFRAMKARGIRIPVSWGHQPDAWPLDPDSEPSSDDERAVQQYHMSAFNAGYVEDMSCPSGSLASVLDCPGVELDPKSGNLVAWRMLPDGTRVKCAIGEVSVAIKDWTDGTGKTWDDAIVHVALTPLPVAHGTGGFTPASGPADLSLAGLLLKAGRAGCSRLEGVVTLSLSNMTRTLSAGEGAMDDTKTTDTNTGGADHMKAGLEFLKSKGIGLPEDTNEANFWERLAVAKAVLESGAGGEMNTDAPAVDGMEFEDLEAETPTEGEGEGEGEDTEMGGYKRTMGNDGETYSGEDEEEKVEEERPVMMSLATVKDPVFKGMLARQQESKRRRMVARIDALVKRGLSPAKAAKLKADASGYTLSLTREGEPVAKKLDFILSALEESMPKRHPLKTKRVPAARPDVEPAGVTPEEIKARAAAVSTAGAK